MSSDSTNRKLFQVYHLSEALNQALDQLEANPELPMADLSALLEALTGDINAKVEDIGLAIRNSQARISAKEAEIIRLKELVDIEDGQVARLKESLMGLMNRAGISKVKGKLCNVSICANGGVIPIIVEGDMADLPEEFRLEKTVFSLNRAAVEQAQAVGLDLPDIITISPRGQHVRVS